MPAEIELTDRSRSDISSVKALSDQQFGKVFDFFSDEKKISRLWTMALDAELSSFAEIGAKSAESLSRVMINLAKIAGKDAVKKGFLKAIGEDGFDQETIKRIERLIELVKREDLKKEIEDAKARFRLALFGLPHLHSVSLMADYRVLPLDDGRREIIPSALIEILIHDEDETESGRIRKIVFQSSVESIDLLMKRLSKFKTEMQEEINSLYIKEKVQDNR